MSTNGRNGKDDPSKTPTYTLVEAAHCLRIPSATLRSWVLGREYSTRSGSSFFMPLIEVADRSRRLLSFLNLVELHVLDAIRRDYEIPMQKVRRALGYLKREFHSRHPLIEHKFETDGKELFVRRYAQLIHLSESGQLAILQALEQYLRRIERDPSGLPVRLFPFTRKREVNEPKAVVVDPRLAFGRPVIAGTGIPTATVAERYKAGESIEELAGDYGLRRLQIEEAIRCELPLEAA